MGMLELYTLFYGRFQQTHLQRVVGFAPSFRHPLSVLFLMYHVESLCYVAYAKINNFYLSQLSVIRSRILFGCITLH